MLHAKTLALSVVAATLAFSPLAHASAIYHWVNTSGPDFTGTLQLSSAAYTAGYTNGTDEGVEDFDFYPLGETVADGFHWSPGNPGGLSIFSAVRGQYLNGGIVLYQPTSARPLPYLEGPLSLSSAVPYTSDSPLHWTVNDYVLLDDPDSCGVTQGFSACTSTGYWLLSSVDSNVPVPEPASSLLFLAGLGGALFGRRRIAAQ